jgi:CheY-like chemotaxis protein
MLALEGYDVHTASNGEDGLREAKACRPDAILLDLRMPLVDGFAFLQRLRANADQRDTPVAIVTGDYFVDDTLMNALRDFGAALYFKPLWLDNLVHVVQRLIDGTDNGGDAAQPVGSRRRLKLLLVDDSVAERGLYQLALEREFSILTASRGDEGAAVASRERPDVIVLDVAMPGIDGWETCTRIKRDPHTAGIPVIFLTGIDDADAPQRAMAVGASALVRKPCPAGRLRNSILNTLRTH